MVCLHNGYQLLQDYTCEAAPALMPWPNVYVGPGFGAGLLPAKATQGQQWGSRTAVLVSIVHARRCCWRPGVASSGKYSQLRKRMLSATAAGFHCMIAGIERFRRYKVRTKQEGP